MSSVAPPDTKAKPASSPWRGFRTGLWQKQIDVRDFIQQNVERVDVLPFHQLGRFKWQELGLEYALDKVEPPSSEALEQACASFRAAGLKAYLMARTTSRGRRRAGCRPSWESCRPRAGGGPERGPTPRRR